MAYQPGSISELGRRAGNVVTAVAQQPIIDQKFKQFQALSQNMPQLRLNLRDEIVKTYGITDPRKIDMITSQLEMVQDPMDLAKVASNVQKNSQFYSEHKGEGVVAPGDVFDDTYVDANKKLLDAKKQAQLQAQKQGAVQQAVGSRNELTPDQATHNELAGILGADVPMEQPEPVARGDAFKKAYELDPTLTYKEFEDYGGKALPTREDLSEEANRESLMGYRDQQAQTSADRLDLDRQKFNQKKQEFNQKKNETTRKYQDARFDQLGSLLDDERQWQNTKISNSNLIRNLNKAVDKIVKDGSSQLDPELQKMIQDNGYEGPMDIESLQQALSMANQQQIDIESTLDFLKKQQKFMRQNKGTTGSTAAESVQGELDREQARDVEKVYNTIVAKFGAARPGETVESRLREFQVKNRIPSPVFQEAVDRWKSRELGAQTPGSTGQQMASGGPAATSNVEIYRQSAAKAAQFKGFKPGDPNYEAAIEKIMNHWKEPGRF